MILNLILMRRKNLVKKVWIGMKWRKLLNKKKKTLRKIELIKNDFFI